MYVTFKNITIDYNLKKRKKKKYMEIYIYIYIYIHCFKIIEIITGKLPTKRVDLKCSHHRKEIVIMWRDTNVSQHYVGNHFAICKCIRSTRCPP